MCLRIRLLDDSTPKHEYAVDVTKLTGGVREVCIQGLLEWWDGRVWRNVPFVKDADAKKGYAVFLHGVGYNRVAVIKAVLAITGKGLKEAKGVIDAIGPSGSLVASFPSKELAEAAVNQIEAVGGRAHYT